SAGATPLAAPAFLCRMLHQTTAAEDEVRLADLGIDMNVAADHQPADSLDPPLLYAEQPPQEPPRQSEESHVDSENKDQNLRQRPVRTDFSDLD
ncbi:hypothetical protein GGI05_001500, partial [Coemansia sp. RSA 2603]